MTSETKNVIEFASKEELDKHLLLKNGNFLYKLPYEDKELVLKVYYGSRSTWQRFTKSFNNVVLLGQTSYWPLTRLKIERECVKLWNKHGFRTFDLYEDIIVKAPGLPDNGYLLFGYVDAPDLEEYLFDDSRDLEQRKALYRRFIKEWCRRHDVAEELKEPKLMHENGDFGHIFVMDDDRNEFCWFDLEMVYRSADHVHEFLWHELIQYLWYILRKAPPHLEQMFLDEVVLHYPNKKRLREAPRVFLDHPRMLMRVGRKLDGYRKKQQKPTSKFNVARRLIERIDYFEKQGKLSG